jgi:Nodulation protein S (NodS)
VTARLPDAYFNELYATSDDPWQLSSPWYEERKYSITLSMLPRPRYRHAFEPGCSIGTLTARLAVRCDAITATDVAAAALDHADRRLRAAGRREQVKLMRHSLDEPWSKARVRRRWDIGCGKDDHATFGEAELITRVHVLVAKLRGIRDDCAASRERGGTGSAGPHDLRISWIIETIHQSQSRCPTVNFSCAGYSFVARNAAITPLTSGATEAGRGDALRCHVT